MDVAIEGGPGPRLVVTSAAPLPAVVPAAVRAAASRTAAPRPIAVLADPDAVDTVALRTARASTPLYVEIFDEAVATRGGVGGDAAAEEVVRFGDRDPARLVAAPSAGHSPISAGADVSAPSPSRERRAVRREDEQPEKRRRERAKRDRPSEPTAYTLDDIVQFAGDTIAVHRQDMRRLLWPF
jgi:hypothetical protein